MTTPVPLYKMMVLDTSQIIAPREDYQRELKSERVKRIVKSFDERIANEPKVSFRDGKYYVFDGQHTIDARKVMNGGKVQIATLPGQQGRNSRSADAIISGQSKTQFRVSSQISSIIDIPLANKRETKQRRSTNGLQTSVGVTLHQWNERQRDCGDNR